MKQNLDKLKGEVRKYWPTIHWDPVSFLTLHEGRTSRLFHNLVANTFWRDVVQLLRSLVGVVFRFLQQACASVTRRRSRSSAPVPYCLLMTPGHPKYAFEERAWLEACHARGLGVKVIYLLRDPHVLPGAEAIAMSGTLTLRDCLWAFWRWFCETLHLLACFVIGDAKLRSLSAISVSAVWQYCSCQALAHRLVALQGPPKMAFSLLPGHGWSVAVVDYMKQIGVPTSGIRTQTTSRDVELLAINTDVLFAKSRSERQIYQEVFQGIGPRLEDGCLLSLPDIYDLPPLPLPESYVLLLGTAPVSSDGEHAYGRFNDRLFHVAKSLGLPMVFKGHNLAKQEDDAWLAAGNVDEKRCLRVSDVRCNRELIDRATAIVSAPSTLLYYAILRDKPIVVVEPNYISIFPDEFLSVPIPRVRWEETLPMHCPLRQESPAAARTWFETEYYVDKGPAYLVDFLLKESDRS
jgi:hypothetical protein